MSNQNNNQGYELNSPEYLANRLQQTFNKFNVGNTITFQDSYNFHENNAMLWEALGEAKERGKNGKMPELNKMHYVIIERGETNYNPSTETLTISIEDIRSAKTREAIVGKLTTELQKNNKTSHVATVQSGDTVSPTPISASTTQSSKQVYI